ncbi:hypothetical protein AB1Y20_000908 [Prymnesium parvum]|uniref:TFIIF beta subunit N-terminal domain-containing protein n=1 Tax=Prymnesium parvum TaxID=97485 RepID=A0AB34KB35_PRYPA
MPRVAMERSREKLWLMKMPHFLVEHLLSVESPGVELGVLTPEASNAGSCSAAANNSFTLTLSESSSFPRDMPRTFNVTRDAPPGAMYVLSEPNDKAKGGAWHVEGSVEYKGEVRPKQLSKEYKSIVSRRVQTANAKREIEVIQDDDELQDDLSVKQTKQQKAEQSAAKRQRRDEEEKPAVLSDADIRDAIFAEFAEQPFLRRTELMQSARLRGQTLVRVNKVLQVLCEHIVKGPNKGHFQLKAEYGG